MREALRSLALCYKDLAARLNKSGGGLSWNCSGTRIFIGEVSHTRRDKRRVVKGSLSL